MADAPANAKVCVICGEDCSGRARTRDPRGRYACNDCLLKQRLARGGEVVLPPLPTRKAAEGATVGANRGPRPEDDDILSLAEDDSPPPPPPSIPCPCCSRPLAPDAVVCVGCGFNRNTGERAGTEAPGKPRRRKGGEGPKPLLCAGCGYNLHGLRSARCPECGTVNVVRTSRRERDREESRRRAKRAYITPACMLAGGLAATAIILGSSSVAAIPAYLLVFAIGFVVSLIVYLVCSVIFIGFDEPLPLTAMRLAGVYAVVDALFAIISLLPFGFLGWVVISIVWVGLMVEVMEIETLDAVIFGVLSFIAKVLVVIAAAALL